MCKIIAARNEPYIKQQGAISMIQLQVLINS